MQFAGQFWHTPLERNCPGGQRVHAEAEELHSTQEELHGWHMLRARKDPEKQLKQVSGSRGWQVWQLRPHGRQREEARSMK
jgi:hypothetical protein